MDNGFDDGTGAWRPMRRLNLNQLYTLDAILKARTLTEAGRMMSLSQPGMSMALRRLRDNFQDELVVYGSGDRRLTALGKALRHRVGHALRVAGDAFDPHLEFDPARFAYSIAIAAPEAIELLFLARVVREVLDAGPDIDVRLMPFDYGSIGAMFDRGVDVAIVPAEMADPRLETLPLFELPVAGLVWTDNVDVGTRMGVEQYLAARHVALFPAIERQVLFGSVEDPLLARRKIVVRTGLYSTLPNLVIGTGMVATLNNWLAQYFAAILPVRLVDLPLQTPPTRLVAQWESHRRGEPVIRWMLDHLLHAIYWKS